MTTVILNWQKRVILILAHFSSKKRSNVLLKATYPRQRISTPQLTAVQQLCMRLTAVHLTLYSHLNYFSFTLAIFTSYLKFTLTWKWRCSICGQLVRKTYVPVYIVIMSIRSKRFLAQEAIALMTATNEDESGDESDGGSTMRRSFGITDVRRWACWKRG